MANTLKYTGENIGNEKFQFDSYNPSKELKDAVNLAILLKQPLLLMGEPGCGKTALAKSVALELHGEKWQEYYFRWDIKSTSKAKEGIYYYDALNRLYDANTGNQESKDLGKYITYGKFAEALSKQQNDNLPNILLIDEIDKADIDFPNDLLLEIEKGEFFIQELNKKVERKSEVIIFITSNRERELPPAFLRRCLYHYIDFPSHSDLKKIIRAKFNSEESNHLVENAVNLFMDIREKIESLFAENEKKPSTSELLEWFKVIDHYKKLQTGKLLDDREKAILKSIENYKKGELGDLQIPFQQVLLKTVETNQIFTKSSGDEKK